MIYQFIGLIDQVYFPLVPFPHTEKVGDDEDKR